MSATQANHDHSLSHASAGGQNASTNVGGTNPAAGDGQFNNIDPSQLISLLRHIPGIFGKVCD
jgi:hypothetical protein